MTSTCEVQVSLAREPYIEGKLVTQVQCSYPGCTESMLGGIVVSFLDRDGVHCRGFCSELHAIFELAEIAARSVGSGEVVSLVRRHLAGEVLDGNAPEDIDSDVDRILGEDSGPAA